MDFKFTSELPPRFLPKIWCDLNACGWSGEPDDNCYYSLHREQLAALQPSAGMKIFIWDWSDSELVLGCQASLERFNEGWRARPIEEIWFEGKPDDTFKDISN